MSIGTVPVELGSEKIGKLLVRYAIPAIIAMTASSLYHIVDSIFIGQGVGPYAISGLAITFPFMNLAAAFGTLVGVGACTLISMLLGQKNYEVANKVLGNVVSLSFVIGGLFSALSLIFLDPILYFFGASENTIGYAREYMVVILAGNIITHTYFGLNAVLRSSGHPKEAMVTTIVTVILNIIFAPIFIFVFDMGIRGAALATILAQIVGLLWLIRIYSNKNSLLHFERGIFKINRRIAKESLAIGVSPFLMNVAACFVVLFINLQLKRYGDDMAVGAYGIVNRVVFLLIMVMMGLTQGMQPIVGYNYGAKLHGRVLEALKITAIAATIVGCTGFILGELFPRQIVGVFTSDATLIENAIKGLRITLIAFPVVGFQIVISNLFQSLGMVKRAIFLSLTRQLIFFIPGLILLPLLWDIDGVWIAIPTSDSLAALLAAIMLLDFLKSFRINRSNVANICEDVGNSRVMDNTKIADNHGG